MADHWAGRSFSFSQQRARQFLMTVMIGEEAGRWLIGPDTTVDSGTAFATVHSITVPAHDMAIVAGIISGATATMGGDPGTAGSTGRDTGTGTGTGIGGVTTLTFPAAIHTRAEGISTSGERPGSKEGNPQGYVRRRSPSGWDVL